MSRSLLTVIIPTEANAERKPYVEACVRTLSFFTPQYEIIVVSNGSHREKLNLIGQNVRHFSTPKQGQCGAVNFALSYVQTPYVMVSNDDMLYGPHWQRNLGNAVDIFSVVSPNLAEPHGGASPFLELGAFGDKIKDFKINGWFHFAQDFHKMVVYQPHLNDKEHTEDGFNLPFLTTTEILRTIGGYDEAYDPFGSNSDPDLMYRFMLAGLHPTRMRGTIVWHFSLQSSERGKGKEQHGDWFKNWNYFIQKWGFERQAEDAIWYAGGENGIRIPTPERPYIFEHAAGHGEHPGKDWLEFHPDYLGKFGEPFYGKGKYYGN